MLFYYKNINWTPSRAKFYPIGEIVKIGHRGAPISSIENTIESFVQAFHAGLKGAELDVQLSKDGKLVVYHDWSIKNKNGLKSSISALTYSEIIEIFCKDNYHIPLLNDVLNILPNDRFFNIEIKSLSLFNTGIEGKIIELISQKNLNENISISSFNPFVLRRIKKLSSYIHTAFLWTGDESQFLFNSPLWIWICQPDSFHIDINYLDKQLILWAKKKGLTVLTFTVNNLQDFSFAKKMGVDGFFTDDPFLKLVVK